MHQRRNEPPHLRRGVCLTKIVLPCKLPHIAIKMLRTDFMEDSLMRTFQGAPEALNAVGVNLAAHVFGNTVLDGCVVGKGVVKRFL